MSVKHHKIVYSFQPLNLVVGAVIAWIVTHLLDGIAKRIRASINASDRKSLEELGNFFIHFSASFLGIDPAEEESCLQRNKKLYGMRGGFYVFKEFMLFSLLT